MKKLLKGTVVAIYVYVLLFVIINGTLRTVPDAVGTILTIVPVGWGLAFLLWAKKKFAQNEEKLEKNFDCVFLIYLTVMFILQIIPAGVLKYTPMWDLDAVFGGAISWLNNGDLHEYSDYFLWFPNNFGLLTIYRCIFTAAHAIWGEKTNYYLIATIMGSISLTVMRFSVVKICRKILGTSAAYTAMLLMALCPVLYFMSEAFYTDVLSMWAAPLAILLFINARESENRLKKVLLYYAAAVSAALGAEIKFTVLIIVIALGLSLLIRGEFKELGIFAVTQLAIFIAVFAGFNALYYANFDKAQASQMNTPVTHWIMMGACKDGRYNGADYNFTRSFSDTEERDREIKKELIKRYNEMGLGGAHRLRREKTAIDFGDGTLAISDFLDDNIEKRSAIHEVITYDGKYYKKWFGACGVYLLILLISMLSATTAGENLSPERERIGLALNMCFIGLWIFLMMWEASGRYFSNYYGILLLSAVWGIDSFDASRFVGRIKGEREKQETVGV